MCVCGGGHLCPHRYAHIGAGAPSGMFGGSPAPSPASFSEGPAFGVASHGGGGGGGGGGGKREGPAGANLFVFSFPVTWGDFVLAQCFMPYGNILSANVFIDKTTGLSKGFGAWARDARWWWAQGGAASSMSPCVWACLWRACARG